MAEGARALFGAIELGGSKVLCALGDREGLGEETRILTTAPEPTLAAILAFFAPVRGRLEALGIASFGPVELAPSPDHGVLLSTPKAGWQGARIGPRLRDALGVPVAVDTDVNAAALAEQRLGAGQHADPCVYVTVGTGIGVGVALGGGTLKGILHPELGHLPAPPLCDFEGACPFHGRCLEGVASASALARRAGRPPHELTDDDPLWALEARYLGHLLAACVLAYAPARIVLGGGVLARRGLLSRVRSELLGWLAGYVTRPALTPAGIDGYVRPAALGQRAGLAGAWLLATARAPG